MMSYRDSIKKLLTAEERRLYARLSTPQKIQDYLDSLPVNFEMKGETYFSPRLVLRHGTAHCMEAALLAASLLAYQGREPWLMDLRASYGEEDHVIALFREHSRWGAISKTNHAVWSWRDPVYASPRELALSYFHEYIDDDGRKVLRSYSKPFDLRRYAPERWIAAEEHTGWLVDALDRSPHFPAVSQKNIRTLRRASPIERDILQITKERDPWPKKK